MRVVLALIASIVLACAGETPSASERPRVDGPWQAVPVPFDATFAAEAEAACGRSGGPVTILHDQRGMSTDIVVAASAVGSAYCVAADPYASGGLHATEGSSTPDVPPAPDPKAVTATVVTTGPDPNGDPRGIVIGRAGEAVGRVRIVLADGREVTATLSRGWFAAWWPGETQAASLIAEDLLGLPLGPFLP